MHRKRNHENMHIQIRIHSCTNTFSTSLLMLTFQYLGSLVCSNKLSMIFNAISAVILMSDVGRCMRSIANASGILTEDSEHS